MIIHSSTSVKHSIDSETFGQKVLAWFDKHGRKNLPWQKPISPYRVWISEIMLQQTQVATVIPYFLKFMESFPELENLAAAELDSVLHLWTGLGYYARARNLHRAAQMIQTEFQGKFPSSVEELQTLPGIGRSTAGAISAIAFKEKSPILDGNVKRVLTRLHAVEGWPEQVSVKKELWKIAEYYTPTKRVADYTQAMMDLGASVCTRTKPNCTVCPLQTNCLAHERGQETDYPGKKPKKKLPVRDVKLLILIDEQEKVFLEKRPPTGIWGGLWGFPEFAFDESIEDWCQQQAFQLQKIAEKKIFRHTFSHFHLDITPIEVRLRDWNQSAVNDRQTVWYDVSNPAELGFAAPTKKLLVLHGLKKV